MGYRLLGTGNEPQYLGEKVMMAVRYAGIGLVAMGALVIASAPSTALAAADKESPACGQVSFRALIPGAPDGEQDAAGGESTGRR